MLQAHKRSLRKPALFAAASLLSLLIATPALATCDPTPTTEPINNIATDGTQIVCTLANTGQTIFGNANQVRIDVANGGSLDNSSVQLNGNQSTLYIAPGGSSDNLHINIAGDNTVLFVSSGASATHFNATLVGNGIGVEFDTGSTVTIAPGTFYVSATSSSGVSSISLNGTLTSTGNNGGQYLLTGGSGAQNFAIGGTLNVQTDGLAIDAGDGDDSIFLAAGSVIAGGLGNNILFDGGNGNDLLAIAGAGVSNYSSVEIERLIVNPGVAATRTLNGTGDYANVQLVNGTTVVGNNAALGQSNSAIQINAAAWLDLNFGSATSFGHTLTGNGTLEQSGQIVTYTGDGSGFGGTFLITGGTAVIASNNAFGVATITNDSALEFGSFTLGNNIGGTGTVTKTDTGVGVLSGTNSYSGGTFVQGGTLSITAAGAVGSGSVTVAAGTTFDLNFATDQLFSNDVLGAGGVTKNGAGIVDLTGNNNYGGGTIINAGGIRVDDLARLGTGAVVANAGAFLILDYNGGAALQLGTTFLSGSGGVVKEGTGEVEITTINSWSGGTQIREGTLRLVNGGGLGTGQIRVDTGAVLALGNAFSSPTVNNDIAGAGTILLDSVGGAALLGNNLGFTGAIDLTSPNAYLYAETGEALGSGSVNLIGSGTLLEFNNASGTTIAATLTGAGTFQKYGAGVLDLTGNNSLTGLIDIRDGTLRIESGANIGSATVAIASGAFFDVNTSGMTIVSNTINGPGRLSNSGTGTLVLTGANSYSGGTDIYAGSIRVTDLSALGSGPITVFNGALLDLSIAGSATLGLAASGNGRLRKSDVGDLTLLSNSLSGGIDITGGRVIVNTSAALGSGPVTTAADTQLVFDNSTTEVSSTLISGAGALTKNGTGTLVLQNANSYTGGTVINAGRLGLNDGGALGSGAVLVQFGAILGIGDIALANSVTGGGQIVKTAGGNATLTGTNTHTGGIDIQGGSVGVTGSGALGTGTVSISSDAQLIYTTSTSLTFGNALSGAGTFNKQGNGMVTFSNPFAIGALAVNAGRVRINSVATTNATVAAGATLDGTGRIVGNLVNNGTVAPGNSIGTLTVQGNYVQNAGAVLEIEFDAAGGIDLLSVTGSATLNGGTLRFVSVGGAEGSGGTFLTAAGGVTGTFATVETVGAQLPLAVIYQPNSAIMAPSVLTARPSTFNAQSFAAADTVFSFVDAIADAPRTGEGRRLWLQGFGAEGNRSASGTTLSYGHRSYGMSGGLILPVGGSWSVGAAIGWASGDIDLGSNGGGGEQDSLIGALQLQHSTDGAAFAAGLVAGKVDQATTRNVSFNGFAAMVTGDTQSSLIGGYLAADVRVGRTGGWDFGVSGRASLIRQSQDGYTESGTSPLRLAVGEIDTTTIEGRAGLSAKRSFAGGLDLRFDLGARYLGATGDRTIPVTFAASNAEIVLQGDTRDGLHGYAAARLGYRVSDRVTLGMGYSGQIGQTDRHEGRLGLSIGF